MSKAALIDAVAASLGGTKADAARAVDAVAGGIATIVAGGERIILPPLGTFTRKHRAERQGMNLHTKEPITIAAKDVIGFKPSKKA